MIIKAIQVGFLSCLLLTISSFAFGEASFTGSPQKPSSQLALWYGTPATNWMTEALPIGNGRLGAMVFGGVSHDHIQFNDNTLWSGDSNNFGSYQNFGDLYLDFSGLTSVSNYTRWLDLKQGVQYVRYTVGSTIYTRTYFCSKPDNVIVITLTSNRTSNLDFTLKLSDAHSASTAASGNRLTCAGQLGMLHYEAQALVLNSGGSVTQSGSSTLVSQATSVTILLSCGTDYSPTTSSYTSGRGASGLDTDTTNTINAAAAKSASTLLSTHLADYQPLFNRLSLSLNSATPTIPTDRLISGYTSGKINHSLEVLLFQYGRYLTISSSRSGLPSNLQGLWNNSNSPSWSSDYHTDINVEMNYFATDIVNLPECSEPYTNWIYNEAVAQPQWTWIGTSMLGDSGWTIATQNNVFGESNWGQMYSQNAWLCNGLWRHYLFTMDRKYLRSTAYPAMKSASQFWLNRLITGTDGTLIAPQGSSPEHGPVQDGIAFDQQLVYDLFTNTIQASQALNVNPMFQSSLKTALSKLDNGMHVGDWGQLKEWKYTDDDPSDTHRHQSYAICLYPGAEHPRSSPNLMQALEVTLDHRGDGGDGGSGFGWDHVWKMALRARLLDGNHAYSMLTQLLQQDIASNLFDIYGGYVFQIDANFGSLAGMSEMLMQSHSGYIYLLPAIPSAWPSGSVSGLVAQGNFTVSQSWIHGGLRSAVVLSNTGGVCRLRSPQFARIGTFTVKAGGNAVSFKTLGDVISFNTSARKTYTVSVTSPSADFVLSALPTSLTTTLSQPSASTTVSITQQNGFSSPVVLSLSSLPAGVTGSFSQATTTTKSQLTLTSSSIAANGPATVKVLAVSGGITHVFPINLLVTNGIVANGTYCIVNMGQYNAGNGRSTAGSGLGLDSPLGGRSAVGLDQQPDNGPNQWWKVAAAGNGHYSIVNSQNSLALTSISANAQIQLKPYTGAANQLWSFNRSGSQYQIVNCDNGQAIDNSGANPKPGNPVFNWTLSGAVNHNWSLLEVGFDTTWKAELNGSWQDH